MPNGLIITSSASSSNYPVLIANDFVTRVRVAGGELVARQGPVQLLSELQIHLLGNHCQLQEISKINMQSDNHNGYSPVYANTYAKSMTGSPSNQSGYSVPGSAMTTSPVNAQVHYPAPGSMIPPGSVVPPLQPQNFATAVPVAPTYRMFSHLVAYVVWRWHGCWRASELTLMQPPNGPMRHQHQVFRRRRRNVLDRSAMPNQRHQRNWSGIDKHRGEHDRDRFLTSTKS